MSGILQNQDIVCFGPSDWWGNNPSCCTHIVQGLSDKNRIIYVNPISSDLLAVCTRRGLYGRITRKLKSLLKFFRKADRNLYILSPVFLPLQGNPVLDKTNNILLKLQLAVVMFFFRVKKPLLWVENIRAADFIKSFDWGMVIYHVSDRFEECPYTKNKDKLKMRESLVTQNSDLIFCVSEKLYESKKNTKADVHYLPHGVDFDLFRNAAENQRLFAELKDTSGPIAGYFGTLTAQNDIELLQYCAENLKDVKFIFAGQITAGDYSDLAKMPNVIFLGRVPYEKIPELCATFSVCLLPWKMSEWIKHCNPLKMFEYMASGKPIVSVAIEEVMQYSDVVSITHSKEEFCDAIQWELQNDTSARIQKRIKIAEDHSWDKHVKKISDLIVKAMAKKPKAL
jgi:glycosyltransferase involved in cell wall biosynthesis